ncbi:MAG TPA: SRPBCC family protein [Methylophaga aminisulfidivorans]|uniref:SRPBCC family protein n=2 Tax=root TaxID=1 RepID=A0A7C1VP12_9GAMM|nr:SRPBCC family protein [Methylophaga aminisulfidivorans]
MKIWAIALLAGQFLVAPLVFAHGPTPQKIDEKVIIPAPVETVWKQVADFSAMADWHPDVVSEEVPEEGTRVLTLKNEGEITESLDEQNDKTHMMSYRLLEENIEAFPVSFYTVTIQLTSVDAGTEMSWQGRFYRADTSNFPPENYSDEAAVKAMQDFALNGMNGLKSQYEGKSK